MRRRHGAIEKPARRRVGAHRRRPPAPGEWRRRAALVVTLAALGHGAAPAVAAADRVALVIGNSAYEHTSRLRNPVNDATAMRDALTRLGFDVVFSRDADEDAMEDALAAFEEMSAGADLALVFYAGHGMEMNGANYLVPVDARLSSSAAVGRETVALDDVLNAVAEARTRIVILDACRNNPFTQSMRGAVRANVRSGGLAAVAAGAGSLVAYAAAAGDVADDGDGRHSPFTEALLAQIEQPGVDVRIMLGNVGEAVRARTGRQQPFVYSSLSGEHYLADASVGPNPAAVEAALGLDESARRAVQRGLVAAGFAAGGPDGVFGPMTRAAIRAWQRSRGGSPSGYLDRPSAIALGARVGSSPPGAAASPQHETVFWQSIADSTDPADFDAYLQVFPNGLFRRLAENRLQTLATTATPNTVGGTGFATRFSIEFGDDTGDWARDGECDDIRFHGDGVAPTLLFQDRGRDAADCRQQYDEGRARLFGVDLGSGTIDFGDDASNRAHDGQCADPRFDGEGMDSFLFDDERGHDAADCRRLYDEGRIRLFGVSPIPGR